MIWFVVDDDIDAIVIIVDGGAVLFAFVCC